MPISPKQRRHLRALAHHLDPVVTVRVAGATDAVIAKLSEELEIHELLKVRISGDAPESAKISAEALAARTGSEVAQVIGRIAVLYKARAKKPTIRLPAPG
jgi:RNA-binding protein